MRIQIVHTKPSAHRYNISNPSQTDIHGVHGGSTRTRRGSCRDRRHEHRPIERKRVPDAQRAESQRQTCVPGLCRPPPLFAQARPQPDRRVAHAPQGCRCGCAGRSVAGRGQPTDRPCAHCAQQAGLPVPTSPAPAPPAHPIATYPTAPTHPNTAQGARPPAPGGDACARQYACRSKTACDKRLCAVCCVPLIHMVHNNNTSSFLGALRCARILRASGASRMRRWKRESHVYTPPSHVSWSGAVGAETTWMEADMQVLVCGTTETVERLMLVSRQVGANSCSRLP